MMFRAPAALSLLCISACADTQAVLKLQDLNGRAFTYKQVTGHVAVIVFVSTRCPMSNAFNFRLNNLYQQFGNRAEFLVIDSNVNESREEIRTHAKAMEYDFAVYRDIDNEAADHFGATATPQAFVIDRSGHISYRGYIEDSPNPQRAKDPALRLAIEAALENRAPPVNETHGRGCAIRRKGL